MPEILANLDLLTEPVIQLETLSLDGVQFGSHFSNFPRDRIVELTLAKVVHSQRSGTGIAPEYRDASDRTLSIDEVTDSVFRDGGIVHFQSKLSFKIISEHVAGFAIYGSQLNHFSRIKTYQEFVSRFGLPDHKRENEAYGDLMTIDNFYYRSKKLVVWDVMDVRVSLINLGAYPGNDGHHETA